MEKYYDYGMWNKKMMSMPVAPKAPSPYAGARSTYTRARSPYTGAQSTYTRPRSPYTGARSPYTEGQYMAQRQKKSHQSRYYESSSSGDDVDVMIPPWYIKSPSSKGRSHIEIKKNIEMMMQLDSDDSFLNSKEGQSWVKEYHRRKDMMKKAKKASERDEINNNISTQTSSFGFRDERTTSTTTTSTTRNDDDDKDDDDTIVKLSEIILAAKKKNDATKKKRRTKKIITDKR
jgi:hypothetical protein